MDRHQSRATTKTGIETENVNQDDVKVIVNEIVEKIHIVLVIRNNIANLYVTKKIKTFHYENIYIIYFFLKHV